MHFSSGDAYREYCIVHNHSWTRLKPTLDAAVSSKSMFYVPGTIKVRNFLFFTPCSIFVCCFIFFRLSGPWSIWPPRCCVMPRGSIRMLWGAKRWWWWGGSAISARKLSLPRTSVPQFCSSQAQNRWLDIHINLFLDIGLNVREVFVLLLVIFVSYQVIYFHLLLISQNTLVGKTAWHLRDRKEEVVILIFLSLYYLFVWFHSFSFIKSLIRQFSVQQNLFVKILYFFSDHSISQCLRVPKGDDSSGSHEIQGLSGSKPGQKVLLFFLIQLLSSASLVCFFCCFFRPHYKN